MPQASATVQTPNASRYLTQLCKHFAHKIAVEYDPSHADCHFEFADATLNAGADGLEIAISSEDQAGLDRAKFVIGDHLLRFAFRENLPPISWKDI